MRQSSSQVLEFTYTRSKLHRQSAHNSYAYRLQFVSFAYHDFAAHSIPLKLNPPADLTPSSMSTKTLNTLLALSSFWNKYFRNYKDDVKAVNDLLLTGDKRHFKVPVITR
ncbi:hypothetical protein Ddye_020479 [Dipteronia dyeriana]|uniref:Uncharacterized protein n=1 Tax=Dipteronia dyeriana TaxID=168575 RepID=A0AAD9WVE6_9ROSI|nr:hypothetical protein Ddye_020479 [Dipteronia dyeriana]